MLCICLVSPEGLRPVLGSKPLGSHAHSYCLILKVEMENERRMEEQKAREEKVRQEKLAEAAKKQREREAELEEKAKREREERLRARPPVQTPTNGPANAPAKFVPRHLREATPVSAPAAVSFSFLQWSTPRPPSQGRALMPGVPVERMVSFVMIFLTSKEMSPSDCKSLISST